MDTFEVFFTGVGDLFKTSWIRFKKSILNMFLMALLGAAAMGAVALLTFGPGFLLSKLFPGFRGIISPFVIGVDVIADILVMMGTMLVWMILILDDKIGLGPAVKSARAKYLSFLWVGLLTVTAVIGGFILLIVPGVIFSIWFFFGVFVLVDQDIRGMNALKKSREIIRGRWWPTFGRILIMWLISVVFSVIPVIGQILSLLLLPFSYAYWAEIYIDLKSKGVHSSVGNK